MPSPSSQSSRQQEGFSSHPLLARPGASPARVRRMGNPSYSNADHVLVELKRPCPEEEIHNAPLVWLQPVQLDGRDRTQIEPVNMNGIRQRPLELLVLGNRRTDERRSDRLEHLLL